LTEAGNLPPDPGLAGNTLRQIVFTSIGGTRVRVQLSNAHGNDNVVVKSVRVAKSMGGDRIDAASDVAVTFSGLPSVTIPAGDEVFSDSFDFPLEPLTTLAVSMHFGDVPSAVTGHPGSRTTSHIAAGDAAAAPSQPAAATSDQWYFLTGIDVLAPATAAAVVILGDSITDGRGSTTNGNNRWPDNLSRRLRQNAATSGVAVLNLGIGGNAVLEGGLGPTARQRFDRDVLAQRGVRWLIILEGVNDIGSSGTPATAEGLIGAYEQFVDRAHVAGIRVYGVPILPFGGSQYDADDHESYRQAVNDWIRNSGKFDAVIDLDAAVRDSKNPQVLLPLYDSGDHLHLSVAGYERMADAIDLTLFSR
jgi:lysophospholipase L1-like esterase